ncbi:MAG TPA: GNAT family N-acetyltransferase [Pseudomonadales bacterium]
MNRLPLVTSNLVLRDFTAQDLPAYRALRMDAKFQRFASEDESTDRKAAELLQLFIDQSGTRPRTKYQLAITLKDGTLIGSCGVRRELERERTASFGIEIGRAWHGTGFAREAGDALIRFAFETLPLDEIYAETISENLAAVRLCRALGLRFVDEHPGARTFKGRSWTTAVYAVRRA